MVQIIIEYVQLDGYKENLNTLYKYTLNLESMTYSTTELHFLDETYQNQYIYELIPTTSILGIITGYENNDTLKLFGENVGEHLLNVNSAWVSMKGAETYGYTLAPTQLTLNNSNQLSKDIIAYGQSGIVEGTLEPSPLTEEQYNKALDTSQKILGIEQ